MKQIDKDALKFWEALKRSVYEETPIDESMSEAEIERHRMYLESHPTEWMRFFFPELRQSTVRQIPHTGNQQAHKQS